MEFLSIFDVLGPNMIGPSSSHTAGAASIGRMAWKMFQDRIRNVKFILYGSFARTCQGHGTDKALLGGFLDLKQMIYVFVNRSSMQKNKVFPMNIFWIRRQYRIILIRWTLN